MVWTAACLGVPAMRIALALLLLAPLAFAAGGWEGTAAMAIVASAALLGIAAFRRRDLAAA